MTKVNKKSLKRSRNKYTKKYKKRTKRRYSKRRYYKRRMKGGMDHSHHRPGSEAEENAALAKAMAASLKVRKQGKQKKQKQ